MNDILTIVKRGLRFTILQRDDFTCQYCGARPPGVRLEVDHIVPRARGGRTRSDNLITACFDCNQGKKAKELSEAQIVRFTTPLPIVVATQRPAPRARSTRQYQSRKVRRCLERAAIFKGGHFEGMCFVEEIPIASSFVYIGPDTFIGQFICNECGFHNTYEGDHCSCRRRAEEPNDRYCDCGELLDSGDDELCRTCWDGLYLYCWDCGEGEQLDDSRYCEVCQA